MDKFIKVKDSQVQALLAFYDKELAAIREKMEATQAALNAIELSYQDAVEMVNALKDNNTEAIEVEPNEISRTSKIDLSTLLHGEYPKTGSWWDRIRWVLRSQEMVMSAAEIAEGIYRLHPEFGDADSDERKLAAVNIFSTLSNKFKDNRISRIKENGEYKYGFNEWFDAKNMLIEKYFSIY